MRAGMGLLASGVFALMLNGAASGQMAGMDMSGAKATMAAQTPAMALDEPLSLFEHEMMGVAKAMPADKYGFAPSAAAFVAGSSEKFDGVRSFSAQATHVAEANYYFYSAISGMKPDFDQKTIEALTQKDDIVEALAKSFAFAHRAVATITPENLLTPIKPVDGMKTRLALAAFGVAHGYDHYGQMVEYLRMNGVVPPGSK